MKSVSWAKIGTYTVSKINLNLRVKTEPCHVNDVPKINLNLCKKLNLSIKNTPDIVTLFQK